MSTPPAVKSRNGKGKQIKCPNAPECEVAQVAADALSMIDVRLTRMHEEHLDFRRVVLESNEEILKELRGLRGEVDGV